MEYSQLVQHYSTCYGKIKEEDMNKGLHGVPLLNDGLKITKWHKRTRNTRMNCIIHALLWWPVLRGSSTIPSI